MPTRPLPGVVLMYSGGGTVYLPSSSVGGAIATIPYMSQLANLSPDIPGISILHAYGFTATASLVYNHLSHTLTLTSAGDTSSYTLTKDSYIVLGSNEAGCLLLRVVYATLPASTVSATVSSSGVSNTLFEDPDSSQIISGGTTYRCLYLMNYSDEDISNLTVAISSGTVDILTVGTEYLDSVNTRLTGLSPSFQISARSNAAGGRDGSFSLRKSSLYPMADVKLGSPFGYVSAGGGQVTDGRTSDLPITLTYDNDPTGKLARVAFASSIQWETVRKGFGISFWVKKIQPPNPPVPTPESIVMSITATI